MPPRSSKRAYRNIEHEAHTSNGPKPSLKSPTPARERQDSETSDAVHDNAEQSTDGVKGGISEDDMNLMIKNFVRLALACERTRTPIRREDVSKKVIINDHRRCFQLLLDKAQERLRTTFGMQMVELPAKDRTKSMTMTQQRKVAHIQASTSYTQSTTAKGNKSWTLVNLLPPRLKQISQRQHMETERNYNAVLMTIIILVVMSDDQCCSENRMMSALERLAWIPNTPAGPFDDVISRMTKQGYLERLRDEQSLDGAHTLHIGPRGKLETLENREEMTAIITAIYGLTEESSARDRLKQIIQDTLLGEEGIAADDDEPGLAEVEHTQLPLNDHHANGSGASTSKRRKVSGRTRNRDEDDD